MTKEAAGKNATASFAYQEKISREKSYFFLYISICTWYSFKRRLHNMTFCNIFVTKIPQGTVVWITAET